MGKPEEPNGRSKPRWGTILKLAPGQD